MAGSCRGGRNAKGCSEAVKATAGEYFIKKAEQRTETGFFFFLI